MSNRLFISARRSASVPSHPRPLGSSCIRPATIFSPLSSSPINTYPRQSASPYLQLDACTIRLSSSTSSTPIAATNITTTKDLPEIKTRSSATTHIVGRSGKLYSPWTVKTVELVGRLLGYNLRKSNAVTLTSDYYDRCAARFELEKDFWVNDSGLPDSFQTWFQVTQLHIWLLTTRFRAMPPPLGRLYTQEFVNHAFLDIEERIRGPQHKVSQGTLVKKYMQIMLQQHRGAQTGMDWAISLENHSDQMVAAAIWRNIFGAAWGRGMGGVKGIFTASEQSQSGNTIDLLLAPIDPADEQAHHTFEGDVKFAEIMERLVIYVRRELVRLDSLSDKVIMSGRSVDHGGITSFGKI